VVLALIASLGSKASTPDVQFLSTARNDVGKVLIAVRYFDSLGFVSTVPAQSWPQQSRSTLSD
jgi:hypothetical protein